MRLHRRWPGLQDEGTARTHSPLEPPRWPSAGIGTLFPAPRVSVCFSQSCECHIKNFQLPSPGSIYHQCIGGIISLG